MVKLFDALLLEPLQTKIANVEYTLNYFAGTREKLNVALLGISTTAQIRNTAISRLLTIFFGLVSIVGILQLFPEFGEWKPIWLRAITLLIVVVAILSLIYAFGAKIYNKINSIRKAR